MILNTVKQRKETSVQIIPETGDADRNHTSVTGGQKQDHSRPRQSDPSLLFGLKFAFLCGALKIKSWQENAASVLSSEQQQSRGGKGTFSEKMQHKAEPGPAFNLHTGESFTLRRKCPVCATKQSSVISKWVICHQQTVMTALVFQPPCCLSCPSDKGTSSISAQLCQQQMKHWAFLLWEWQWVKEQRP